jgi:hypothetical protein
MLLGAIEHYVEEEETEIPARAEGCNAEGLEPIATCREASPHLGVQNVVGMDLLPARPERGREFGIDTLNIDELVDSQGQRTPVVDPDG